MRGKYSPTVSRAYMADQEWWTKYSGNDTPDVYNQYDPEGYDSYGYDKNDVDRAGNHEYVYYSDNIEDPYGFSSGNSYYDDAYDEWKFDGVKPVKV